MKSKGFVLEWKSEGQDKINDDHRAVFKLKLTMGTPLNIWKR